MPDTLLSTFHSSNVNVSYDITAMWKKRWGSDEKQTAIFSVVPSMNMTNSHRINVSGTNNKGILISIDLENQSYETGICIKLLACMTKFTRSLVKILFIYLDFHTLI